MHALRRPSLCSRQGTRGLRCGREQGMCRLQFLPLTTALPTDHDLPDACLRVGCLRAVPREQSQGQGGCQLGLGRLGLDWRALWQERRKDQEKNQGVWEHDVCAVPDEVVSRGPRCVERSKLDYVMLNSASCERRRGAEHQEQGHQYGQGFIRAASQVQMVLDWVRVGDYRAYR